MQNISSWFCIIPKACAKRLCQGFIGLICCSVTRVGFGNVVTFDDLTISNAGGFSILTDTSYAGLSWERGNIGLSNEMGAWVAALNGHPHSGLQNAVNGQGSTLMPIGFPSAVNLSGAFFAVQGNIAPTTAVRVHGYLNGQELGVTPWLTPLSTTPAWLDMSTLTNIDRIVVESAVVSQNIGAYGMDDLTFTYIPEPGTLGLLSIAGITLLARRRAASCR